MNIEDLLCDACLYKLESNRSGVALTEFCGRCLKKILSLAVGDPSPKADTLDEVD